MLVKIFITEVSQNMVLFEVTRFHDLGWMLNCLHQPRSHASGDKNSTHPHVITSKI